MKVFVSWSGEISHKVALVIREWLPSVIQSVEPYVSSEDIDKGSRWLTDISKELDESYFGILCVTHESLEAPWLNFEAGALSKAFDSSNVIPFLFGLKRSEVQGPLLQFQSVVYAKEDVRKLVISINKAQREDKLEESRLDRIFNVWWPKLEKDLSELAAETRPKKSQRKAVESSIPSESEILEEILELSRRQQQIINRPDRLLPEEYLMSVIAEAKTGGISSEAINDLLLGWNELTRLIETHGPDGVIPSPIVLDVLVELEKPIAYIVSRSGGRIRARRMRKITRLLRPENESYAVDDDLTKLTRSSEPE